jgi:hypothetical protein
MNSLISFLQTQTGKYTICSYFWTIYFVDCKNAQSVVIFETTILMTVTWTLCSYFWIIAVADCKNAQSLSFLHHRLENTNCSYSWTIYCVDCKNAQSAVIFETTILMTEKCTICSYFWTINFVGCKNAQSDVIFFNVTFVVSKKMSLKCSSWWYFCSISFSYCEK